ncbi:MAG: HK97 family phage prohead protease [Streptomyces sp.]|nr:HK97 family phage prohead protease [Streptomyces sp.]
MTLILERRSVETQFDIAAKGDGWTFTGYAAKYGTRSHDLGGFKETIRSGAFTRALGEGQDVRALINHDAGLILGRTVSGTLKLSEDTTGLHYEVDAPDTSYARDLAESMRRGDVTQSSFAFRVREDDWQKEGRSRLRTLIDLDLLDVSPVTYPAYEDTESGVTAARALQLAAGAHGWDLSAERLAADMAGSWNPLPPAPEDNELLRTALRAIRLRGRA